jgi:hypothetical protein
VLAEAATSAEAFYVHILSPSLMLPSSGLAEIFGLLSGGFPQRLGI